MLRIITITTITTTLRHPLKEFSFRAGKEWGGGCLPVLPAQHAFSGARTGRRSRHLVKCPPPPSLTSRAAKQPSTNCCTWLEFPVVIWLIG